MAYSGAKGDTATEFRKSLMFPEKLDSLFEAVKASTTSLQEKANVTLNIANAMFMQQNYTILDSFKKHIVDIFKAEAQNVDFSDVTQSCKSINDFVNKSTNGKITQLLDESEFRERFLIWNSRSHLVTKFQFLFSFFRFYLFAHKVSSCECNLLQRFLETSI